MRSRPRAVTATLLACVAVLLTSCTAVPESSSPQVVKSLPAGGPVVPSPTMSPAPGVLPRTLVLRFLDANAEDASNRASAGTFLTPAARSRWSDNTVTVISGETVSGFDAARSQVVVRGRVLGTVYTDGVFTPTLQGSSGPVVSFTYGIAKVRGQYRISNPHAGLLLKESQFLDEYQQRSVDFYDLAHRYLVPDPRWTSITDPAQLISWLMAQLVAGPVDALQNSVSNDTLPTQATARRINVTAARGSAPIRIEIPGSSELPGAARNRLAAQLGAMVDEADRGAVLQITDGGRPVRVPDAGGTDFTGPEFTEAVEPPTPAPDVYYVRDGRVVDGRGRRLAGKVNGQFYLTSVAASRTAPGGALAIAGVSTIGGSPTLVLGTQPAGLRATPVSGVTSRPAFAPGRDEVWVGADTGIKLVATNGRVQSVSSVALPSSGPRGRIVALRLSPEGSRIALAIEAPDGTSALYVASIVRAGGPVRLDSVQQVSEEGARVTDVAWLEPLKLFAIGYDNASRDDGRFYDVGVDGSVWTADGFGELPDPPTSISVLPGQRAWVTSNDSVWVQSGGTSWRSPGPGSSTHGSQPVYLE